MADGAGYPLGRPAATLFIKSEFFMIEITQERKEQIDALFEAGAHFGYSRSKRHPSMKGYVFGAKNNVEIINLDATVDRLEQAKQFAAALAASGKKLLFVGSKNEGRSAVREAAESVGMPYVINRWIGGTLTNFSEIQKRIALYKELTEKREKGALTMYTKKERLLIDRDIEDLETNFGGLISLEKMPGAMFIVDPRKEEIAVKEAEALKIPIIALANLDCNTDKIAYTIPGNDGSRATIQLVVSAIAKAYGKAQQPDTTPKE